MKSKINKKVKGFYKHLLVFIGVNFTLFVINALTTNYWWFWIITIIWSLAIIWHGLAILIKSIDEIY